MLRRQQKEKPVPVDSFPSDEETAVEADAIDDNYVSKVSSHAPLITGFFTS